jgi:hypothetical protein
VCHTPSFDECDSNTRFGESLRYRGAGQTASNDGNIRVHRTAQRRIATLLVSRYLTEPEWKAGAEAHTLDLGWRLLCYPSTSPEDR